MDCPDDFDALGCETQTFIDAAFLNWKNSFGFTGGCGATATDLSMIAAPPASGGSVTIDFDVTDLCGQTESCSAVFTVANCLNISGKLIWEGDRLTTMTGVNSATVRLDGGDPTSVVTGIPGTYSLTSSTGTSFTVVPFKNKPQPGATNGLTAMDATKIQQHVTGMSLIADPYKLIAADANKSKTVTTTDAYLVTQAIMNNPVAVLWFTNNTWRFVPKSVAPGGLPPLNWTFPETITLPTGIHTDQDFIGVKLGDVDATAVPANAPSGAAPHLVWTVQDQVLVEDATITAEFKAQNYDDLMGLQFALKFDQSAMQFLEIEAIAGSPLQASNFGLYDIADGEIRAVLAGVTGISLPDGAIGFRVKFKALQSGAKLSELLSLEHNILQGQAYDSDFAPGPISLAYESVSTGTNEAAIANFSLLQNRPNPFSNETVIGFKLPEACEAQIRVFDLSGRLVEEQKAWFAKGYNERAFRFDGYTGDGMLYYELVTPYGILSKKMMLIRK